MASTRLREARGVERRRLVGGLTESLRRPGRFTGRMRPESGWCWGGPPLLAIGEGPGYTHGEHRGAGAVGITGRVGMGRNSPALPCCSSWGFRPSFSPGGPASACVSPHEGARPCVLIEDWKNRRSCRGSDQGFPLRFLRQSRMRTAKIVWAPDDAWGVELRHGFRCRDTLAPSLLMHVIGAASLEMDRRVGRNGAAPYLRLYELMLLENPSADRPGYSGHGRRVQLRNEQSARRALSSCPGGVNRYGLSDAV